MAPAGEAHSSFTMAALLAVGGAVGYAKAGSLPSLAAGLGLGAGFGGAGYLLTQGEGEKGHGLSLGLSVLLSLAMGQRFIATGKVMPPGMLAGIGLASAVYHGKKFAEWSG